MDVDLVVQIAACEFPRTVIDLAQRPVNVVPEDEKQEQRENEVDKSDYFLKLTKAIISILCTSMEVSLYRLSMGSEREI